MLVRLQPPELLMNKEKVGMGKRKAICDRMRRHQDALQKANEYLATGANGPWQGFRAMFDPRPNRLPHRDWVANVFMRRRRSAIDQCEYAIETLISIVKERRVSQQRKGVG